MLVSPPALGYVSPMINESSKDKFKSTTTNFGYRRVPKEKKANLVRDVFDSVADKYDLMNDLMSMGVHRLWKNAMINWLAPRDGMTLVDVGGGTGDIAFRFLRRGGGSATVVDINVEMLSHGRDRALDRGILDGINWLNGDAEDLPYTRFAIKQLTTKKSSAFAIDDRIFGTTAADDRDAVAGERNDAVTSSVIGAGTNRNRAAIRTRVDRGLD